MNSVPNIAQTRSTEQDAGVLKREKEKLMDISSPQQDINDVDVSLTVSSPEKYTLLVDINVALIISILHETVVKHGYLALSTKKSGNEGLKKSNIN